MEKENNLKTWLYEIYTPDQNMIIRGLISADSLTKAKIETCRIKDEIIYKLASSFPNTIYTGMSFITKVVEYGEN